MSGQRSDCVIQTLGAREPPTRAWKRFDQSQRIGPAGQSEQMSPVSHYLGDMGWRGFLACTEHVSSLAVPMNSCMNEHQ